MIIDLRDIYYAVQALRILLQLYRQPPKPWKKLKGFIRLRVEEHDHQVIRSIEFGFERKF